MHVTFLTSIAICSALVLGAGVDDERAAALRAASVVLASTDPAHADFTDLEPLVERIGGARVVSLGEITHGDGSAFLARTRLVRFLHERLGFDVLAFESGLIECERVMEALRTHGPIGEAIELGIYNVWAQSAEMRPLFEYVRATQATDRPLRLVGFDPQFSSDRTPEYLRDGFAELVDDGAGDPRLDAMLRALGDPAARPSEADFGDWAARLDELERAVARSTHESAGLWTQAVASLRWQLISNRHAATAPPIDFRDLDASLLAPERVSAGNARDQGMADNLLWHLHERWPGSRAIVWAANNHVRTSSARRSTGEKPVRERRMGEELERVLGDELYTVLATCYEGAWASASVRGGDGSLQWQHGEHAPAAADTLAALLHESGAPAAWVDLETASEQCPWLEQPLTVRAGFHDNPPHRLAEYCDAILFIDVIEPATPAE